MGTISEKKNRKSEDRVIRTPNLLIWNQTRYRCAMPSCLLAFQLTTWETDIDQFRWLSLDINWKWTGGVMCYIAQYWWKITAFPWLIWYGWWYNNDCGRLGWLNSHVLLGSRLNWLDKKCQNNLMPLETSHGWGVIAQKWFLLTNQLLHVKGYPYSNIRLCSSLHTWHTDSSHSKRED